MRNYLLVNGSTLRVKKFKSNKEAYHFCLNYFNHSKYVGYFEVKPGKIEKVQFNTLNVFYVTIGGHEYYFDNSTNESIFEYHYKDIKNIQNR